MYCSTCGSKISDDARFCPLCGAATSAGVGGQAPGPSPATSGAQGSRGDLGSQVRRARRLSLAALSPTVLGLLIAFFVLTTVAVAAALIYFNIYLPSQQQGGEQAPAEQPVDAPEDEPTPDDEQPSDAAAFGPKLLQYQEAQSSGWQVGEGAADDDVAGVAALFSDATAANAVSGEQASWVASYAVEDVNGDGLGELVVALVGPDGDYRPLAVYATDGTEVSTVAADLPSSQPQTITLCADGTTEISQTGQWGSVVVMGSEGGAPVELSRFEWGLSQGSLTWSSYERGELVGEGEAGGLDEVFAHMPEIDDEPYEGLDWQPISSYGGAAE